MELSHLKGFLIMKNTLSLFFSLFFSIGCANASHIELGSFNIKVNDGNSRIKVLKDEGIYLSTQEYSAITEVWRLPVIFNQDTRYIDSVIDETHLFTVEDYIGCNFLNSCTNSYLQKKQLTTGNTLANPNADDICSSKNLKCLLVSTQVPGYEHEVLVYSSNVKAHYLRVLTKSMEKEKLKDFLNQIHLKGI